MDEMSNRSTVNAGSRVGAAVDHDLAAMCAGCSSRVRVRVGVRGGSRKPTGLSNDAVHIVQEKLDGEFRASDPQVDGGAVASASIRMRGRKDYPRTTVRSAGGANFPIPRTPTSTG